MARNVLVLGGGIVGLATAWQLARRGARPVVLEKELELATHQTGRNSGVVHSGVYYAPGSLKAETCRRGKALLEAFCAEHGVAHERCGKVIVATRESELPALERIHERGLANGVACERIDRAALRAREPHVAGIAALLVPEAGIVDFRGVCAHLADDLRAAGGEIVLGTRVERLAARAGGVAAETSMGLREADAAVNCTGLHSDLVARRSGADPGARIVPFRGEYYELVPEAQHLCRHLVYPVPDPRFPFLGVHFTRMVLGGVECGPNAVLALAREGYRWRDVSLRELADALGYPGTWRLFARHWRTGLGEAWRSLSKRAFVRALQRLVPDVRAEHLRRAPAGVRAQALREDGGLVDDFVLRRDGRIVHVTNAPSPAATASLAIGERVAEFLEEAPS